MQRILIVEDERDIADLVGFNLERAGYQVLKAHDGITGAEMAIHQRPDLVILDLMLPGKDGYGVFKEIRRDSRSRDIPVILLTARAQTEDRIQGLEAGADDYLTKPFSPKELMLRVQAALKRSDGALGQVEFSFGPFRFERDPQKFYFHGHEVELSSTEFKLLRYLAECAGTFQHLDDLFSPLRGYADEVHSRTLQTHLKQLRQKLDQV
jgi:two-component system phosphate regulon response regulator PhoB